MKKIKPPSPMKPQVKKLSSSQTATIRAKASKILSAAGAAY